MGAPLSPIVANLFMESFEKRALQTAEVRPRVWLRYVDNIFAVWSGSEQQLCRFHEHLNHQHPNIQFTTEEEIDGRITFLDVQVERYGNGVRSSVFQKRTHTDRYINFHTWSFACAQPTSKLRIGSSSSWRVQPWGLHYHP